MARTSIGDGKNRPSSLLEQSSNNILLPKIKIAQFWLKKPLTTIITDVIDRQIKT